MAASYTISMSCRICGTLLSVTNVKDVAAGNTKEEVYKCAKCGVPMPFLMKSIAVVHSGSVGSNTTITHTVTIPGSIASAVS
jgi:hypothetical protein